MFDIEIAGQMAAWFVREQGGTMSHLKLMRLLYLAERTSIERHGFPVLGDKLVSMDHGPVLSITLNYMQGYKKPGNGWDKWISSKKDHKVSLARKFRTRDLDLLSQATLEILENVWGRHGHVNQWDICDHAHEHCPEWQDPRGSFLAITYEHLLRSLGHEKRKAEKIALELEAQREISESLTRHRFPQ